MRIKSRKRTEGERLEGGGESERDRVLDPSVNHQLSFESSVGSAPSLSRGLAEKLAADELPASPAPGTPESLEVSRGAVVADQARVDAAATTTHRMDSAGVTMGGGRLSNDELSGSDVVDDAARELSVTGGESGADTVLGDTGGVPSLVPPHHSPSPHKQEATTGRVVAVSGLAFPLFYDDVDEEAGDEAGNEVGEEEEGDGVDGSSNYTSTATATHNNNVMLPNGGLPSATGKPTTNTLELQDHLSKHGRSRQPLRGLSLGDLTAATRRTTTDKSRLRTGDGLLEVGSTYGSSPATAHEGGANGTTTGVGGGQVKLQLNWGSLQNLHEGTGTANGASSGVAANDTAALVSELSQRMRSARMSLR